MVRESGDAPVWLIGRDAWDFAAVDRILTRCHDVVAESRARRLDRYTKRAQHPTIIPFVRPRAGRRPSATRHGLRGGAGLLDRVRVVLVTNDVDTRDLMGLLLHWFGATVASVTMEAAPQYVATFRPDLVLMDLPFARDRVFAMATVLREQQGRNGGKPRLVALTRHSHDHSERDALAAGFDAQIAEPVEPEDFERTLLALSR